MAKVKCPKCGTETDDSNEFCPKCGKRLKKSGSSNGKFVIVPIVIVAAGVVAFLATAKIRTYNKAVSSLKNKDYQEAASEFETLSGYKNSDELLKDANYRYAKQELKNGNYEEALKKFTELGSYKDSADLYQSGNYQYAEYLMKVGKYDKAADIFQSLQSYKDSGDKYVEAVYQFAKSKEEKGDYTSALAAFQKISSYGDSASHIAQDQHLADVQEDKTPPTISGINDGDEIDIDMMSGFNMLDYLRDKVHVTDNVSGDISDYRVSTNADGYNPDSGLVDTQKSGPKTFIISAKDEAGNTAKVKVTVNISDVIGISADNPNPVIYQDANYLVKFSNIKREDGIYAFLFSVTNNTDQNISVDVLQANADDDGTSIQLYSHGYNEDVAVKNKTTLVNAGGFSPDDLASMGLQNFNEMKMEIDISNSNGIAIDTVNISVPRSMLPS